MTVVTKTNTMKKIILILTICLSVIVVTAQSSLNGSENSIPKNAMMASLANTNGEFIENITVYPNPVMDILKVSIKSNRKSIAAISIYNNIGKQIFRQETAMDTGNNLVTIDIRRNAIEPGIYFIKCSSENEVFTRKLIVK